MKIRELLLVSIVVSSCGGGSSSSDIDTNTPITQTPDSTNETCINTQITNFKRCNLVHNSIERLYYIYEPENLDASRSIPVLFALHGYGSTAMRHFNYTNYESIADANNLFVIYPQGSTNSGLSTHWNNGGCTSKRKAKDIELIDNIFCDCSE